MAGLFPEPEGREGDVVKSARGASWKRPNWPPRANGDLVAALDGHWAETEKAIGDKIKAKAQAKVSRSPPPA